MGSNSGHGEYRTFEALLSEIPRYDSFFTVGEHRERDKALAEENDCVTYRTIGKSAEGNDIWSVEVGQGNKTALFFAAPHPNEPIGSMTIDFLVRQLAKNDALRESLDYQIHAIKTIDLDGTLLNQGWFDGPFTISNYAQNFYRPASYEQVEWTFPMEYEEYAFNEPLPETEVLMELITELEPEFVYSLHNAGFGGCYYYLSEELTPVFDDLRRISRDQGVPLDLGEPETPYMEEFDDAVFEMPSATQQYDYYAENTEKDPTDILEGGAGSLDFAQTVPGDTVELVTELPYFYDEKIESDEETDRTRREVVLEGADNEEEIVDFLRDQFERVSDLLPDSRLRRAVEELVEKSPDRIAAKRTWANENPDLDDAATVAQRVDSLTIAPFYRMLYYGTFMRLLDHAHMAAENEEDARELADTKSAVEERFCQINGQLLDELDYKAIPIRKLVAIQVQAGLICMDYLDTTGRFD